MKSLAELQAIKEKMKGSIGLREEDKNCKRIVVGMATCGIAAGARPVLSFTAKRRGKPPSHLADLDAAGRKAVLGGMGLPPFRADQ